MLLATGLVLGGALFSRALSESAGRQETQEMQQAPGQGEGEKKLVDIMASRMYSDQEKMRSLGIDERAQILVGNVAFHHNGAVIACDSAVRYYSANRLDCYGNVIINKDSTFVYGDRAEYDGDGNMARVYSPVVKVVDGTTTLYTTQMFSFNTADNIGTWTDGGVVYSEDNTMESERGYFYSDLNEMVGVQGVQMRNDSHELTSDSVRYNTDTKVATFYTKTYIWTEEGEMISAIRGRYNSQDSTYFFHDNAYVLDEFRESWADTIDYNARARDGVFYGNVQIDDREHSSSAFGDLAHYWGERGETRLTRRPALLNYDVDQGNADTLYMRADTVYMFVRYPSDNRRRDSIGAGGDGTEEADRFAHLKWVDSLSDSVRLVIADSLAGVIAPLRETIGELRRRADSIMTALYPSEPEPVPEPKPAPDSLPALGLPAFDSLPLVDSLLSVVTQKPEVAPEPGSEPRPEPEPEPDKMAPPEVVELREQIAELTSRVDSLADTEGYIRPRVEGSAPRISAADSLARLRLDSLTRIDSLRLIDSIRTVNPKAYRALQKAETRRLKAQRALLAAERREAKYAAKAAARIEKQRLRAEKRAARAAEKATRLNARRRSVRRGGDTAMLDSLARADSTIVRDSLLRLDSLLYLDSIARRDSLITPADSTAPDTTMRIFRGWRNVKIWRKDMQAVADSMVGFSADSTVHLYRSPILWHAENQVTADSMTIFTANQQIEHAEFYGNPIMGSQIGDPASRQFNQVKGRSMSSWFRDGEIYRHDADENAQAYYYIQEEEPQDDGSVIMSEALGFIVGTGSGISFTFETDSLISIVWRRDVDYTIYPMHMIPPTQPKIMQGFAWRPERRPELSDVFDRTVRSSERAFHDSLPHPDFPIAARIIRRREYLTQNRMWADRSEPLPAYAIEFRRQYYREPTQ
jgi:lipopolysaccharide export system protein LptA